MMPGRYALEHLGGGHRYEAYLAWDDHLFTLVVIKIVRPHLVEDQSTLNGLEQEINSLRRLHHPMLVRSFGGTIRGSRPHVVLEHLEGPHLARLVRRTGPLPLEQLVPLALQVASVVRYMSLEGVVHLDVKPRNIIMGAPPRLIDLSIARSVSRARRVRGHVGTDLYMAPEQCDPKRWHTIGSPADVWGLGITLYHAAEGTRAFDRPKDYNDKDLEQRFPQLVSGPPPMSKHVPREMADIIVGCLQDDPAARPDAQEITLQLEPVLGGLPRRRILGRPRPSIRRNKD